MKCVQQNIALFVDNFKEKVEKQSTVIAKTNFYIINSDPIDSHGTVIEIKNCFSSCIEEVRDNCDLYKNSGFGENSSSDIELYRDEKPSIQNHTGDKQFMCDVCNMSFAHGHFLSSSDNPFVYNFL